MIVGRVGLIGSGKTMLTVRDAIEQADRRGAVFASNIWTADSVTAKEWLSNPVGNRVQLATGRDGFDLDELDGIIVMGRARHHGVVLMLDEVGILVPARMWQRFGVDLMMAMSQSRKNRVDVWWTSQDVEDVDAYLRRKTSHVFKVRAFPVPSVARQERGKRPWFFYESRWRPGQIGGRDKRLGRSVRRYRRSDEFGYDTDELVRPAARLTEADLCARHTKLEKESHCPACIADLEVQNGGTERDLVRVGADTERYRSRVPASGWAPVSVPFD